LGELPVSVIHGDYRAQNLLFRGSEVAAVLDLDGVRPAERLFDLAYALVFFQAVVAEDPLTEGERRTFLQAYDGEAALSRSERDLLPEFQELALLRGLTLWIQIAYADGSNPTAAEWISSYLSLLTRAGDARSL
jgi:Ser/Thr protein kinase RdoA (MazF antagonist)